MLFLTHGVKFHFCNWANHSWKRSWQGKSEILVEQTYGDETSWREHFDYLLPFFQDERYIKIDNKPIFIIFDFYHKCIDFHYMMVL